MSQVEKLEALLARIQRNRGAARGAPPSPPASKAQPEPARASKPTPLERAVSDRLVTPGAGAAARPEPARPAPEPPAAPRLAPAGRPAASTPERPTPAARAEPLAERKPAAVPVSPNAPAAPMPPEPERAPERERVVASAASPPSAPIVTTAGEVAPEKPATFGILLERTLRLRPR